MYFTKMEAAGNDFVIFDGFKYDVDDYEDLAIKSCDRHFSVGADGMMICEKSDVADVKMIYYNSDGSIGEMCGNGIRCFSRFVFDNDIVNKTKFTVETLAGIKNIQLCLDENRDVEYVKVNMGYPIFESNKIPVNIDKEKIFLENINIDGKDIVFSTVLVGVPHTIIFVEDIKNIDINYLGRKIEKHPIFPRGTNVNFIEVQNRNAISIYTWERGAGRTLGCGTGSCASVVIGNMIGKLDKAVDVKTEGGELQVELEEDFNIYMKGSANIICIGKLFNV